ncbi:MAG: M14 family metallopeptidase [Gammaproteobacteria bacterium]|nr:M14 family metallopeptidase [Gammaproteobacteria bacterium]
MLTILDHLPTPVLETQARDLHKIFSGPTLVHLEGRAPRPLFLSTLLHGNEPVGLQAVQKVLKKYLEADLPRAVSIFFGNVFAAREGLRRLDQQSDYNRIWPGGDDSDQPEARMMQQIVDIMADRDIFASIDMHNNTGLNPHYACVNDLGDPFLQLASLFGRTVVYFLQPRGVQSMAFARLCPAVTLECGKPGDAFGVEHAAEFVDACLHLSAIPAHPVAANDIELFHTVARVRIRDGVSFGFHGEETDITFDSNLDRLNFRELPAGTRFGSIADGMEHAILVTGDDGDDLMDRFFHVEDGILILNRVAMPSMLTLDEQVVRQDCLCYLMERLPAGR